MRRVRRRTSSCTSAHRITPWSAWLRSLDVKDGVIQSARLGLTGATTHAVRLSSVEKALTGKKADGVAAACEAAAADVADLNGDLPPVPTIERR